MSFSSKEILVTVNPSDGVSCIELKFRFSILGDALNEISTKIDFVIETLDFFKENIKDLKITIDIKYSVEKMLNTSKSIINDLLTTLEYEEKKTYKGEYRKFEIMNKHNITNKVILKDNKKYIDADISINVENIVIEDKDISQEIQFSLYYYIIEYFKLHYNLVNAIDSEYIEKQHNFYNKVKLKI